jgi:hypothetical protein
MKSHFSLANPLNTANINRKIRIAATLLISASIVSGCSSAPKEEVSTSSQESWDESQLFQLSIPKGDILRFGFPSIGYLDVTIKDYSDPQREGLAQEVVSVVPANSFPVASIIEDSEKSGALLSLKQIIDDENLDHNFSITVKSFQNDSEASKKFGLLLQNADKCGSWIPKYQSGESGIYMDLWESVDSKAQNRLQWSNGMYDEADILGLQGSLIYEVYVKIDGNLNKAKDIANKAEVELISLIKKVK